MGERMSARAAVLVLGCLLAAAPSARAEAVKMTVDPLSDGIFLGTGIVLAGASELLLPLLPPLSTPSADITQVNWVDRSLMFPYSPGLDVTSTVLEYTTVVLPGVLGFFVQPSDLIPMGVVYAESLSMAIVAKNVFKYLLPRDRPYVYLGGAPGVAATEDDQSFPSGHATMVFAAATAGVMLFAAYFPDSSWFWPFTAGSYALAVTTASLRVASGMHFLTDVVAGAALGSLCGYLVPLLHEKRQAKAADAGFDFQLGPAGMLVSWRY